MEDITRIPRPTGTTILSQSLQSPQTRKKIQNRLTYHIIRSVIQNGMILNGKQVTIEYLEYYTKKDKKYISKCIAMVVQELGLFGKDQEEARNMGRAMLNRAILGSLNDRYRAEAQADILERAQANVYKPFVSSTYNAAIKNLFDSNKQLLDLYKALNPNPNTSTTNINVTNQQAQNTNYLGIAEAQKLLSEKGLLGLPEAQDKAALYQAYDIGSMPEVRAEYIEHGGEANKGKTNRDHDNRRINEEGLEDVE